MSIRKYSDVHFSWIRDNFNLYSNSIEMARAFEETFDIAMAATQMRALWTRLDLKKNTQHRYTQDEDIWLAEYANTVPYSKLTVLFNEKFDTDVTMSALQQHCNIYLGIYSDDPNQFNNRVAWNKLPLGSERFEKGKNVIVVKTERGWITKARYVYEQAYGEVPRDHQIIFLDSNRENFDLDNLYCIPTKYMVLMNRNNWCTENREITLAAIKYCELHYALEEKRV